MNKYKIFIIVVYFYRIQVKLSGSHLAQQVYAMITYMQSTQSQALQEQTMTGKMKTKGKKKGNVAGKVCSITRF